ncbi:hypothetical protein Aduo_005567 [Ancylostoma duodenale]
MLIENGAITIATAVMTQRMEKHEQDTKTIHDSESSGCEISKGENKESIPQTISNSIMSNCNSAIQMKTGKLLIESPLFINRSSSAVLSEITLKQPKSFNTNACSDISDKHSWGNDVNNSNEGNVLQEIVAEFHQRKDVLNADAAILRDHFYDCPNNSITSQDCTSRSCLGQQRLLTQHSTEDNAVFNDPHMKYLGCD